MRTGNFVRLVAAAAVLLGVAAPADVAAAPPRGNGTVAVSETFDDREGVPIEGQKTYLRIIHNGRVVGEPTLDGPRIALVLPAGRYRLVRYARTCQGTCDHLSDPVSRCRARVTVQRRKVTRVRIRADALRCTMTAGRPR